MPGRKAHHPAGMAIKCQIWSEKKRLYQSLNCVLIPVVEAGSVQMFYLASPRCVHRRIVTYWELFSAILTPKSKTADFLLAACRRQNMAFVFCCIFFLIQTSADGEHVQQGGGGSPRWRHHQPSTDDLPTPPVPPDDRRRGKMTPLTRGQ